MGRITILVSLSFMGVGTHPTMFQTRMPLTSATSLVRFFFLHKAFRTSSEGERPCFTKVTSLAGHDA